MKTPSPWHDRGAGASGGWCGTGAAGSCCAHGHQPPQRHPALQLQGGQQLGAAGACLHCMLYCTVQSVLYCTNCTVLKDGATQVNWVQHCMQLDLKVCHYMLMAQTQTLFGPV